MAGPVEPNSNAVQDLVPDELNILKKRRSSVRSYEPPKWRSNHLDSVSGQHVEQSMVDHASILTTKIVVGVNGTSPLYMDIP